MLRNQFVISCFLVLAAFFVGVTSTLAAQPTKVSGTLIANGEEIRLPYVYVYTEKKGFYDESDPTWKVIFAAQAIEPNQLNSIFHEFPYVKISITSTAAFNDHRELKVLSQDVKLSAEKGNISGGNYPEIKIDSTGPVNFVGQIFQPNPVEFFEDSFQYDFTFTAPIIKP